MIRLLITADDFGSGRGRNAGIVAAFQNGIVTGASLLATGSAFAEAVALARACALPVGVHLNLAEGRPLSGALPGLTDASGAFLGKAAALNLPGDSQRHYHDLAFLLALMPDPGTARTELSGHERRRLRACPLTSRAHPAWARLPEEDADAGHAALRLLGAA